MFYYGLLFYLDIFKNQIGNGDLFMVVLKDSTKKPSCEVELNIESVNDMSVKFEICFRSGHSFPVVHSTKINCLKEDFLKMLNDLKQLDNTHLSMLEPKDPGLCIYHIPQFGTYYFPEYGFLVPENGKCESEYLYKLIFVLDAGDTNHLMATGCGPALCIIVKMEQINEFVDSLISQVNSF